MIPQTHLCDGRICNHTWTCKRHETHNLIFPPGSLQSPFTFDPRGYEFPDKKGVRPLCGVSEDPHESRLVTTLLNESASAVAIVKNVSKWVQRMKRAFRPARPESLTAAVYLVWTCMRGYSYSCVKCRRGRACRSPSLTVCETRRCDRTGHSRRAYEIVGEMGGNCQRPMSVRSRGCDLC